MRVTPVPNLTGRMVYQRGQPHKKRNRAEEEHWAYQWGTDEEFLAWIRRRPSAYSGKYDYNDGVGRCEACHYRTADNAGTGIKPPFSAIPLTHKEHQTQHRVGQYAFMEKWRWEALVDLHVKAWAESKGWKPYK